MTQQESSSLINNPSEGEISQFQTQPEPKKIHFIVSLKKETQTHVMVNCERAEVGPSSHALKIPQLSTAFGVQKKNKKKK